MKTKTMTFLQKLEVQL